jgi:transcriptional regulator with PAS, ATPase and Fis domain
MGGPCFLMRSESFRLSTQVKLLRAIEMREFMRIGDETVTKVDVRIIGATIKICRMKSTQKGLGRIFISG